MTDLAKILILCGLLIALIGLIVLGLARIGFRGLPGDISYQSSNVRVYFPIVTCLVISLLLTLASWLYRWIARK
jgi:Protein of unknown function (DUF2905)